MPKRKRDQSTGPTIPSPPTCILHTHALLDHGSFTALSTIKVIANERLQEILKIRDRRLLQSHGSTHRMQSVCDNIPITLPSDPESVGYHSKCYRRFTAHLDRLKDDTNEEEEEEASTSRQHHSPRKSTSVGSHGPLFPPECILCEKLEIKGADRRTERTETFSSYKNKENAWQQIESRADKMGLLQLHRRVKDKDLFAGEAKHHPSYFKSFRTQFFNYERKIHKAADHQILRTWVFQPPVRRLSPRYWSTFKFMLSSKTKYYNCLLCACSMLRN